MNTQPWSLKEMNQAVCAIEGKVVHTPLTWHRGVALKREDRQAGGTSKWRGVQAEISMSRISPPGIVCVSSGNTGKAVALAARIRGIEAHMFCTEDSMLQKREYVESLGARIHVSKSSFSEASSKASEFAADRGFLFISPGASWPFAYGAASIVPEIIRNAPSVSLIVAPIGGGGLISGIGLALSACRPRAPRLVGVQAANSPYYYNEFHGISGPVRAVSTVADCISGDLERRAIIRSIARNFIDDILLVEELEIIGATKELEAMGIMVEPGAAVGYAAIQTARFRRSWDGHRVCVIVSGGRA
ncbi:pyridoxal-phosphate dependent enzyme [Amycolatopsis keratiniphila]|uniref:Tryptophan synthase beta chain-like PALP domain-containing protein n=1 Tax=Amycolatopsis keratiniphila subsp. keratiniphila TaxID=227715 RepID=A0A1W2M485_9PSEU|nr:pyridoxal-phosphate dependent enzyme [Amycolatopsis keratiniphila]ONF75021.1 hypothetical protein AVR91_0200450 [Amycolatopsis keratiniphila subsp. keratiniphila]